MRGLLRFVGRLLFVTLLLSSAVLKLKQPTAYVSDFTNGYNTIRGLHSSLTDIIPPASTIVSHLPMATLVRIVGAVEALTALLIVFGDRIGGGLLFLYLAVYGVVQYLPNIMTAISKQKVNDLLSMLPQLATFVSLIGFSFVFMSHGYNKKKAISV